MVLDNTCTLPTQQNIKNKNNNNIIEYIIIWWSKMTILTMKLLHNKSTKKHLTSYNLTFYILTAQCTHIQPLEILICNYHRYHFY